MGWRDSLYAIYVDFQVLWKIRAKFASAERTGMWPGIKSVNTWQVWKLKKIDNSTAVRTGYGLAYGFVAHYN